MRDAQGPVRTVTGFGQAQEDLQGLLLLLLQEQTWPIIESSGSAHSRVGTTV